MEKHKRPKQVQSTTVKMETGCGHLYVTVGRDNVKIIELFATLGKAGSCITAQNEALTRAISLGLKYGIPAERFRFRKVPNIYFRNVIKEALSKEN